MNRQIHLYPLHAGIDAIVNEFFGQAFSNNKTASKYPLTDVYLKDGVAHLEIAVAGFSKNEIAIELNDGSLRITGSKIEESMDDGREYIKRDIAKRNFDVFYNLMVPVDRVDAEIVDGVLKVAIIPMIKPKETKMIEIK